MDNDGNKRLSFVEFQQGCKDFKVNFSVDEIKFLFNRFDRNRDGSINYDEFLRAVRGGMKPERKALAERAFNILDKNRNGKIELVDISQTYNAKKHPAVKEGRKTEDQVLNEFLETFEVHHNEVAERRGDSVVDLEEFLEYYNNVSASIDDDVYFEQMMDGSWNLSGDAPQYQVHD